METQLSAFGGEKKRQKSKSVDPTVEKKEEKKLNIFHLFTILATDLELFHGSSHLKITPVFLV